VHKPKLQLVHLFASAVAETNGTIAAAKVSAATPARAFKGMNAMIFLRRLWKIH
jgi:hypothetical protein